VQCDVTVEQDCAMLIKQAVLTFGRVDVLINNAGISMRALFKDVELKVLKSLMDVNFWGTVYCTKYALPEITKTTGQHSSNVFHSWL
jgi:NADP-dependent 3-hydroxy acid dehydrogenase YdfG